MWNPRWASSFRASISKSTYRERLWIGTRAHNNVFMVNDVMIVFRMTTTVVEFDTTDGERS